LPGVRPGEPIKPADTIQQPTPPGPGPAHPPGTPNPRNPRLTP
jgi:hypothetical protein